MAKSPLPLILGAGAALLVLSKRGGSRPANIRVLSSQADFEALAAQEEEILAQYDFVSGFVSTVDGVSSNQIAGYAAPVAEDNPKTIFLIVTWEIYQSMGVPIEAKIPGLLGAAVISIDPAGRMGQYFFEGVKKEQVQSKLPAAYNFALKAYNQASSQGSAGLGGRGLAGTAPIMANATGLAPMSLAGAAAPSNRIVARSPLQNLIEGLQPF